MENLNAETVKEWSEICAEDTPYPDQRQALLDALALINSQEQRIKELAEENERLVRANSAINNAVLSVDRMAKADTVRKMQKLIYERLDISVEGYSSEEIKSDVCDMVDQIAKELLEGKK